MPSASLSSIFTDIDKRRSGYFSDDTSMASTQAEESQDLFPTQDVTEIMEDEGFQRSFSELCPPKSTRDLSDLVQNTPFPPKAQLPAKLPFWYCWELHRLAPALGLVPLELQQQIEKKLKKPRVSYEEFWSEVKQKWSKKGALNIPHRSEVPQWLLADDEYYHHESNKIVYFTGSLEWEESPSDCLFRFRLNQMQTEDSCRFQRKLGADRFLVISSTTFSKHPSWVNVHDKDKSSTLERKINDFLALKTHFIAGRYWRVCYLEPEKKKSKKGQRQQSGRVRITMFAESGFGIVDRPVKLANFNLKEDGQFARQYPKILVDELMRWHMPFDANLNSTDLKLFNRLGLGLSRTTPTVELLQHEFLYRHDPLDGPVMDDGCALISYPLAKAIWTSYGGDGEVPSAVQGRISGAKGLWIVDYHGRFDNVSDRAFWIQVSDSQLKIKPHPRDRADADAFQRTFEVLKFSTPAAEARLNMQLVTVLEDRGVPRSVLREALESDLESFSGSLSAAMKSPVALRLWMQEHGFSSKSSSSNDLGSFPKGHKDRMSFLLESGFHPQECDRLVSSAAELLKYHVSDYMETLRIRLPHSTIVFCAPDPCDVLAENEVFLGFSNPILDPITGYNETVLDNTDVLLSRSPAYLASDVQLRKAVYKHELRNYKDVILFSTRGEQSTAALLSGGDFDGDIVTCIWDPKFIEHFHNVGMPQMPKQEECGMVNKSRKLSDVFKHGRPTQEAVDDFLCRAVAFNTRVDLLGYCSKEHEKLVYELSLQSQKEKLSSEGARTLAVLCGYLVDSGKQGWDLTDKAWHSLRRKASGPKVLKKPAYESNDPPKRMAGECLNVIDFLRFDVAGNVCTRVLADFEKYRRDVGTYDRVLAEYWRYEEAMVQKEEKPKRSLRSVVKQNTRAAVLKGDDGLHGQILNLREFCRDLMGQYGILGSPDRDPDDNEKFDSVVRTVYDKFKAIEPPQVSHYLRQQYEEEGQRNDHFSYWSLLKASCLYVCVSRQRQPFPLWAWCVAGRELCILKLQAQKQQSEVRLLTREMHEILRVDSKFTKRVLERGNEEAKLPNNELGMEPDFEGADDTVELE